MTRPHPNDENAHVRCVAMALLASGRATAAEVADLSGLSLERVQQFADTLTSIPVPAELAWTSHGARGWWLANQWNAEMARLEDDHLDEALRRLDLDDGSIESMDYIQSRYLANA